MANNKSNKRYIREWRRVRTYLGIVGGLFDDFGRHPEGRADESVALAGRIRQLAGHAEIGQFDVALLTQQHIRRCSTNFY